MSEHRSLQAIRAVKAALLNATRAGSNVEIGRQTPVNEADAIDIVVGPDSPTTEYGSDESSAIKSVQRVFVDLHTRSIEANDEKVIEALFEMRAQSHAALLADGGTGAGRLGLTFVISMRYLGTDQLLSESGGDRLGSMRTVWDIAYQMSYADATS